MELEELKESERANLYPPCFVVKFYGDRATEDSIAVFTFEGATKKIKVETLLTKGIRFKMLLPCPKQVPMSTCLGQGSNVCSSNIKN